MGRYASDTGVSVANSKAEIERILERYGADQFMSGWSADRAIIGFTMASRQVRFVLPMPGKDDPVFTRTDTGKARVESAAYKAWEQACRQRWRALALVIKAKLEAVDSQISVFEDEFMANIVLPNGRTVSEEVRPSIALAYETRSMPNLLPNYSDAPPKGPQG